MSCLSIVLGAFLLSAVPSVSAHGRMTHPPARQLDCQQSGTCGSVNGLSAGGPAAVNAGGGYTHGMCGNNMNEPQIWNQAGPVRETYNEGQSVTFEVVLTAHHIGFFEFELCDSPFITEDCFKQHRLLRTQCQDDPTVCRKWWKPVLSSEANAYAARDYPPSAPVLNGHSTFRMQFDLPQGVSCTHCVIRWHYVTTNSCTSTSSLPEEFWNCADVRINAAEGQTRNTDGEVRDMLEMFPIDLRPQQDPATDFWNCPASGVGTASEYSCDLGTVAGGACLKCNAGVCTPFSTTPTPPTPVTPTLQPTPYPSAPPTPESSLIPTPTSPNNGCGSCQGCLWEAPNACYATWSQVTCARYSNDGYKWCGNGSPTPQAPTSQPSTPAGPTDQPTQTPPPTDQPMQTPPPTDQPTQTPPPGNCGSCTGCLWVQYNACYGDWPQGTCDFYAPNGYTWCGAGGSPTPQPTTAPPTNVQPTTAPPTNAQHITAPPTTIVSAPTPFTGQECVTHAQMIGINGESGYWPACDPSQAAKGSASGYIFGHYCTQEWVNQLNVMFSELGYCNQPEVIRKFLAQAAYETGYYSTLGQPLDSGSGVIHMIPANFEPNARDMEEVFPNQGLLASFQSAADKQAFFKTPEFAWKSAAAWFKRTNRVIGGCGIDLFSADLDEQTRCILGRVVSRDEAYQLVSRHIPSGGSPTTPPSPAPAPTTTPPTNAPPPTSPPSAHPSGLTGWERIMSPDIIAQGHPWGISNFHGLAGIEAASVIYEDVATAIKNGPADFQSFCNGPDEEANKRECAAFLANVLKETGGYGAFVEVSPHGTYCTHNGEGGSDLQAAGLDFPCFGNSFIGRGAIQLTWNINYGRFSEFYFGDKEILLRNPEMVEGDGPLGWAASLWFWMRDQDYGGQCPPKQLDSDMPMGHLSCHTAMADPSGGGFGQTIRIINGGYEACPTSSYRTSALYRMNYYLALTSILGVPAAPTCSVNDPACDISGMSLYGVTAGKIGNPLIGSDPSSDCPQCAKAVCTANSVLKWLGTTHDPVNKLEFLCE